jgi:RNA-directed DNA polymerase
VATRFVRYEDDANVYVSSERAGRWVMASLTGFIEGRLRLKVKQGRAWSSTGGGDQT